MEPNMSLLSTVPIQKEPIHDLRLGTPYYPGTICVLLHGARAPVISYKEIVQALKDYAEVDKADIEDMSHLGTNMVWFLRLKSEAKEKLYNKLHRLSFTIEDGSVKFFFKHLEKIYLLGSLHWAPAHFTHTDVEKIARSFSKVSSTIAIRPLGGGSWSLLFSPRESYYIPHFVDVYRSMNEHHTLLLTLVGRVTPCYFCAAYDYRACQCWLRVIANRIRGRKPLLKPCRNSIRKE